ncbi:MAG TPA: AbrB/MazE/SpoVT family DNA-binding domain-containing protein [Candidatus Baltobacteraceae bacterium]|nr:AbrB/MazE/SpoVT family DNA-binding domain-containing protein [Candidatus Baltobacteraceae bacterium]
MDRWGNSLGVRLPKGIVEEAGLREGDRVDVEMRDGAITIRRARPRYTLDELLQGMTPETVHDDEFADVPLVGRERFWEEG